MAVGIDIGLAHGAGADGWLEGRAPQLPAMAAPVNTVEIFKPVPERNNKPPTMTRMSSNDLLRPATGKRYYVVLGSYRTGTAKEDPARQMLSRCLGYEADTHNTSNFIGMTPGYDIVVQGGFDLSEAREAVKRARACAPDAYYKAAEWVGEIRP